MGINNNVLEENSAWPLSKQSNIIINLQTLITKYLFINRWLIVQIYQFTIFIIKHLVHPQI